MMRPRRLLTFAMGRLDWKRPLESMWRIQQQGVSHTPERAGNTGDGNVEIRINLELLHSMRGIPCESSS